MKKFLSVILALTMVIALVPAVFAADEITENNYVFNTTSISNRTADYGNNRGAWSFNQVDSLKSNPFRVAGCRSINSNGSMTSQHMNIPFKKSDYSIFDIHIVVTVDGTVQPTLRHKLNTEGINVDLYLYRLNNSEDINLTSTSYDSIDVTKNRLLDCLNGKAHTQHLGTINTYAERWTGTVVPVELNKVNVTPGEYILVCYGKFAEGVTDGTQGKAVLDSFNLKKLEEDTALTNAFDVEINKNIPYTAPTVTGVTVEGGVIKASESDDGTFTLTADEEDENGNKFLYWAKGKTLGKKIISFSNELTNYMPEANDKNHILIAVYEGDVPEQEEWYNANGQRIATGTKPEKLPSMAGYGTAEGWDDYNDMIHVARYALEKPEANIDITVEKGFGGGKYAYGDTVTCTADEETNGNFKCWTKTGINGNTEIVSVDETYIFQAWETCTVTAVYEAHNYNGNTMKIILDAFDAGNEKAVMAEFIGFKNSAVEKGIIWSDGETTKKIAMTKPGTQFTLTGEVGDTFTGYAIVDNGNGTYNEVTDGSATIE